MVFRAPLALFSLTCAKPIPVGFPCATESGGHLNLRYEDTNFQSHENHSRTSGSVASRKRDLCERGV